VELLVASVLSILYALKFFAGAFLAGPPRAGRLEVPAPMLVAQVALAAITLALGVAPGLWLGMLAPALAGPVLPAFAAPAGWAVLGFGPVSGAYTPLLLVVAGAWTAVLAAFAIGRARAPRTVRTWMGGGAPGPAPAPLHAAGLYVPLREEMGAFYARLRFRAIPLPGWVPSAANVDGWLYRPAVRACLEVGESLQRVHTGTTHRYIIWQLVGALVLVTALFAGSP